MLGDYKEDSNSTLFFVIAGLIHIGLFFAFLGHQQSTPELEAMGSEDSITIEIEPNWGEQTEVEQWALEENQSEEKALPATEEKTAEKVTEVAKAPEPEALPPKEPIVKPIAKTETPKPVVVAKAEPHQAQKAALVLGEEELPPENFGSLIQEEAPAEESFENPASLSNELFADESTDTPSFEEASATDEITPLPMNSNEVSTSDSFEDVIDKAQPVAEPEAQRGSEFTSTEGQSSIQSYGIPEGVRDYRSLSQRPGNKRPSYDKDDRLKRREGQVNFLAYVLPNGHLTDFRMQKSSGHRSLDYKALKAVKNWKFVAGQEGWVEIPILWSLKGEAQEVTAPLRRGISRN